MNKIAEENFENNLDYILLENSSNPKTYCKIMKMLSNQIREATAFLLFFSICLLCEILFVFRC
jgi:transposase